MLGFYNKTNIYIFFWKRGGSSWQDFLFKPIILHWWKKHTLGGIKVGSLPSFLPLRSFSPSFSYPPISFTHCKLKRKCVNAGNLYNLHSSRQLAWMLVQYSKLQKNECPSWALSKRSIPQSATGIRVPQHRCTCHFGTTSEATSFSQIRLCSITKLQDRGTT